MDYQLKFTLSAYKAVLTNVTTNKEHNKQILLNTDVNMSHNSDGVCLYWTDGSLLIDYSYVNSYIYVRICGKPTIKNLHNIVFKKLQQINNFKK